MTVKFIVNMEVEVESQAEIDEVKEEIYSLPFDDISVEYEVLGEEVQDE